MSVLSEDREKIYELCKNYLSNRWTEISANDLIIKPITDGFINKLFYCSLPDNTDPDNGSVVLRFVENIGDNDPRNETHILAISTILSQLNISPKILGVFPNGTINEFINCRYFDGKDDLNPEAVALLAQKLAKLHSLDLPIPKTSKDMLHMFTNFFDPPLQESYLEGYVHNQIQNLQTFSTVNLIDELQWLTRTVPQVDSPVVMSHNDLNRRNILIKTDTNNNVSDVKDMYFIDFDFSGYASRGVDLGNYFSCWAQADIVGFDSGPFPNDHQMLTFIDAYISEMSRLSGDSYAKHAINSRDSLIKECKIRFVLYLGDKPKQKDRPHDKG
ncbi:unnamed protein product [Oppiella nova]|uniref:Uncharacterized protein n=1 Tax=Oppiella nova TaxID=334625 RepID=A0A7R9QG39_9ACAR|nr:unnamed protein product [Oppiella nova]CAG2165229.1 unnamed protein product [Oppiella nova]